MKTRNFNFFLAILILLPYNNTCCERSSVVEHNLAKVAMRVRFPSLAPLINKSKSFKLSILARVIEFFILIFEVNDLIKYKKAIIMSIGLKHGEVILENHHIEWEEYAKKIISILKNILGDDALGIEHIGSTSLPSIKAKPIIDIAVGVKKLDLILSFNDVLNENGFIFRESDHEEQLLYTVKAKLNPDIAKSYIHVVTFNSKAWKNYLSFRDYLLKNEDAAKRYETLKIKLAEKYRNDRKSYTSSKQKFIDEILERVNY